jgi:hypothetical protein
MPDATVKTDAERRELKSLPGGYVDLKPLPYGGVLTRRESAMKMSMEQQDRRSRKAGGDEASKIDVELLQRWARAYEFKHCIVDHNLEDRGGKKLDFGNAMTLDVLDPRIGTEIERMLDEINGEETEEDLEAFFRSATTSTETTTEP